MHRHDAASWRGYVRAHLPSLDIPAEREAEIVDELALQLEAAYDAAKTQGASDADAYAAAGREVPDWGSLAKTLSRIERPVAIRVPTAVRPTADQLTIGYSNGNIMNGLSQDVRYAVRTLLQAPGFAIASVLTLALGIAATAIVYSLFDAILIRPLPIRDADNVVLARETSPRGEPMSLGWPNFVDWKARARSFEQLAAWRGAPANLTGLGEPRRIMVRQVTWNLFDVLGVRPVLGRDLTPSDDQIGVERVCLVSYGFWQRELGGTPDAIGRRITLDDIPATVVGVLPSDFTVARQEDVFLPWGNFYPADHFMLFRGNHNGLAAIGRLAPGVTLDEARVELTTIAGQLAVEYPNTNSGQSATAEPLLEVLVGPVRSTLRVLLGAVAAMLLIACVNIANLMLVRGAARAQEFEVRIALGAERWRIARQLLTESIVIALLGGVVGVALAYAGFDAVIALLPDDQPRIHTVALNPRVLIAAGAVAVATGLLFGLLPALQAGSGRAASLLRGTRVAGVGAPRRVVRRVLLVSELALALVLLAAAGLMVRTMDNLLSVELGFEPDHVLTARVALPTNRYQPAARREFTERVEERLRALPGVQQAAFTISLPVQGSNWNSVFIVGGQQVPARSALPSAAWTPVTPPYFDTLRIRLIQGRTFTSFDRPGGELVAVVNETFARRFWPKGDAIGQRIKQGWPEDETGWREIVGVVADVKNVGLDQPSRMQAYLPLAQMPQVSLAVVVRSEREPSSLAGAVEAAIHEVDPNLPIVEMRSLDEVIGRGVAQQRLLMVLLVAFAGLSLLLAAVGVFGLTAYAVSQRTHEIGVRIALGATRGTVLRLVLREEFAICAAGIFIGSIAALALSSVLESLLFGVAPRDPATLSIVAVGLLLITATACYVPAQRATRVDPVTALRAD